MLQFYNPRERSEELKWYEVAIPLSIQMVDPLQIPVAFLGQAVCTDILATVYSGELVTAPGGCTVTTEKRYPLLTALSAICPAFMMVELCEGGHVKASYTRVALHLHM